MKSTQTKVKNEYLEKWETKTAADSCLAVLKQRAHKTKRFLTHFLDQNSLSAIQDLMCTFHIQTSISMWSKIPCVRKELFSLSVMKKITLFGEFTDQINQIGVVILGEEFESSHWCSIWKAQEEGQSFVLPSTVSVFTYLWIILDNAKEKCIVVKWIEKFCI